MGISDRDDGSRKWVIAGIQLRAPLKPIYTPAGVVDKDDVEDEGSTPTATDAVIPNILPCPPPPRKQKSTLKCNYGRAARDFFNPPDLETIFVVRHVERAS